MKNMNDTCLQCSKRNATRKIFEALNDGKPHRYNELLKITGVSTATLTKHLKDSKGLISKFVDDKSGEYPYPVFYTLKKVVLNEADELMKIQETLIQLYGKKKGVYLFTLILNEVSIRVEPPGETKK